MLTSVQISKIIIYSGTHYSEVFFSGVVQTLCTIQTVTIRCDTIQCNKIFVSDEWPTLETLFKLYYLYRQFTASYTGAIGRSGVQGRLGRWSARFPFAPGFEAVQYTNLTFLYFNSVYLNTAYTRHYVYYNTISFFQCSFLQFLQKTIEFGQRICVFNRVIEIF